ncbi:MAG: uL15m family ribosomal protein [Nanoarchaeota archaeon]|nr:uL15m family ribosomal protein [Nanoarchaeota archaeon]
MTMKVKKRRKSKRFRGSHTHGRGGKKKARGSGHRGGVGMAGTGKRADQRKTLVLNLFGNKYFGKTPTLRRKPSPKPQDINIRNIVEGIDSFVKKGIAKENKGVYEINLKDYKILSVGDATIKMNIEAAAASKSAIDKVKKAGGEIIISKTPVITKTPVEVSSKAPAKKVVVVAKR